MRNTVHPVVVVRKGPENQRILQTAEIPPRSRLYGLEPYHVNTLWSESLTSYLNRLGWAHGVDTMPLVVYW
jgi:hypothetical protein